MKSAHSADFGELKVVHSGQPSTLERLAADYETASSTAPAAPRAWIDSRLGGVYGTL